MNYLVCIPSVTLLLFFTIVGSDGPNPWNMEKLSLPKEMWEHIVSYVDVSSIARVKQVCSTWNTCFHYCTLDSDIVKKIDKERCTRMLCHFAHTEQVKNFKHFFEYNHIKERQKSLRLLNWPCDSRIQQLMTAHKTGWNQEAYLIRWGDPNWNEIHEDVIAATIICLSNNPNVRIGHITFFSWAMSGDYRAIINQLSVNPHIDFNFEYYGCNVALVAIIGSNEQIKIEAVKKLLANPGIDPNRKCNSSGMTALMQAVVWNDIEIVKLLLAHSSTDPNVKNNYGRTALMMAIKDYETVEILIADQGVDINAQDNNGFTALSEAAYSGEEEIVKLLLSHPNIKPNVQSVYGDTALIWAARQGYTRIIKRLLFHLKTDPNIQNTAGSTALMEAVGQNRRAVVRILLGDLGVSRTIQDQDGDTAFMIADKSRDRDRSNQFTCNPNFFYYAYLISIIGVIAYFNAR